MREFLIVILVLIFFTTSETSAPIAVLADDKGIFVHIPQDANTGELQINYLISGSFGGVRSFVNIRPNVRKYEIPTLYDGKSVEKLKVIVSSPHYKAQAYDFPTLPKQRTDLELRFEPLGTVPFSGQVSLPDKLGPEELQVKIGYAASWQCAYFNLPDCITGNSLINSADLDEDGNFTVDLPDYIHDPLISTFNDKGEFSFRVEEKSGKLLFRLKRQNSAETPDEIKPALSYPGKQVFVPAK